MIFSDVKSCLLCKITDGSVYHHKDFKKIYGDKGKEIILKESKYFLVLPGLGALMEGYLTIMSKRHALSTAFLNNEELEDLENLLNNVRMILTQKYNAPTFFEHGPISINRKGGACIDHMHVHAIPADFKGHLWLSERYKKKRINILKEINHMSKIDKEYVFIELPSGVRYIYYVNDVPSQLMRKLIAEHLGLSSSWNWRTHVGERYVLNTLKNLKNWNSI